MSSFFGGGGRQLKLTLIGDSRHLERTLGRTETRLQKFGKNTQALGAGAAGRGGLFGIAGAARTGAFALGAGIAARKAFDLAEAASDLNEQISKSRAVFGRSSAALEQWASSTSRSIGIARTEALQATGTFGNLFSTVGLTGDASADMSKRLVELAADLASFNNASPVEVLDAIRSGLIGEAEPLRRFGVLLSETRVQQEAMTATGKKTVAELTNQEKATARYNIILKDTEKAQGDFARTSGGLANQQRILSAQVKDLQANLGMLLLPAITELTSLLADASAAALGLGGILSDIGKIKVPLLGDLKGVAGKVFDQIKPGKDMVFGPLTPAKRAIDQALGGAATGAIQSAAGLVGTSGNDALRARVGASQKTEYNIGTVVVPGVRNVFDLIEGIAKIGKQNPVQSRGKSPGVGIGR